MSVRNRTVRQLDFSLNQLTEVPLEDLIGSPEFTHVDLSCNLLQTLPNEFSTLTHLVRIDLSKNKLKTIPSDFGNLVNLQYLDLYENEIEQLPVSFCKLKNLQWLDLKNNPLNLSLKKIAGDCLDKEGCQDCAKKVVTYYRVLKKDLDCREAKKLKKAIEKDALEKAKKENEMLEQRKLRKQIKEQRRLEMKKTEEALTQSQSGEDYIAEQKGHVSGNKDNTAQFRQIWDLKKMAFIFVVIFAVILTLMMICAVIFLKPIENKDAEDFKENVVAFMYKFMLKIKVLATEAMSLIISNVPKLRAAFLKFVHACMESVTHYTSLLESMLSVYF